MTTRAAGVRRVVLRVEGIVQGVGFRPYVFLLAEEHGLAGTVLNDTHGVLVDVEGDGAAIDAFVRDLPRRAPPLARVSRVAAQERAPMGTSGFAIVHSDDGGEPNALVAPDGATCADCLAELHDPADRRHRYPFVNCTNCGPRFTIIRGIPYDRPLTTMAAFAMCAACRAEYEDPRDRRFHAQPNACPACGPRARLVDAQGEELAVDAVDAVAAAATLLRGGAIVAVKGLGGYHLACRADDARACATLRARKHREDKPFALMVADLGEARALVTLSAREAELLTSTARPIVLAARRQDAPVAGAVAPGTAELGVMLPYTPLHHLLLADVGTALVMTSGNASDEPIAYHDDDALRRLAAIADALLTHDRPVHIRTDDSVARVVRGRPLLLRRSRGYVPDSITLPTACARPVLACGAELKSTFCVAKDDRAWVGHHIGDLGNLETLVSYTEGIAHFQALFAVTPAVVAHDLHPDYLSTSYALEREDVQLVGVQHHHAHLAAVLAEHGCDPAGRAVGAIYDGTGYGSDGTVWGGEVLVGDLTSFTRAGSLHAVALPGGDRAAREPWRMACSWLVAALGEDVAMPPVFAGQVAPAMWDAVAGLARSGFSAPPTSSMGRLFDAVAALCGLPPRVTYEGQAAIALEALADRGERGRYALPLGADGVLDARMTVRAVVADLAAGVPASVVAARFHRAVAGATAEACAAAADAAAVETVVLSGGVFQNRLLLQDTAARLDAAGLRVLLPERLPPNDGGIAFGQAAVAAARTA
jgi:hydrogenase maturation protein HypF